MFVEVLVKIVKSELRKHKRPDLCLEFEEIVQTEGSKEVIALSASQLLRDWPLLSALALGGHSAGHPPGLFRLIQSEQFRAVA